jgi:hypothetical protein
LYFRYQKSAKTSLHAEVISHFKTKPEIMEEKPINFENSKLLSLIDTWLSKTGEGKSYENVVMELLHGNSCLFVQTHGEQVNETRTFVTDKDTILKVGIYEIEGKKYFGAFSDLDLLEKWLKVLGSYVKLPSKTLLEIADEIKVDGIIINSGYANMFVAFRSSDI